VGLQARRGARASAVGGAGADGPRSGGQADRTPDAALAVPMLRGDRPAPYPAPCRDTGDRGLAAYHGPSTAVASAGTGVRTRLLDFTGNCGMSGPGAGGRCPHSTRATPGIFRRNGRRVVVVVHGNTRPSHLH